MIPDVDADGTGTIGYEAVLKMMMHKVLSQGPLIRGNFNLLTDLLHFSSEQCFKKISSCVDVLPEEAA